MSVDATGEADYADFAKLDIRVGTVRSARPNAKARKPAYVLEIDFGDAIGTRTSSAQIVEAYRIEEIVGRQVIAIVNFPAKKVADVRSQALVLGVVRDHGPTILLAPGREVENGARVL